MSKNALRFPESAIADGRVGTARIREEIAGAAARAASTEAAPLDGALKRFVGGDAYTNERLAQLQEPDALIGNVTNTPGATVARRSQSSISLEHGTADKPELGKLETELVEGSQSPLQRMQQLGRLGTGRMNKTEAAYEQVLAARLHAGEILWYRFEAFKLRLADNTFYTPDFPVITASNELMFIEVKGYWTDKARAKTKMAAAQFPHRFIAVKRAGRHGWQFEDMTSKSW
jgi:hypothetical protein